MLYYFFFSLSLALLYVYFIRNYVTDWQNIQEWETPKDFIPKQFTSVIIAARNESADIEKCLQSINSSTIDNSHYEIILVDDHSTDNTKQLAQNLDIENLQILGQEKDYFGKKSALKLGIAKAKGSIIITTDADCVVGENWLKSMLSFQEYYEAKLITAPVIYHNENSILEKFQSLDIIGLMAITASGIYSKNQYMANGANLLYMREVFEEVKGFKGNEHLASGDDMFLIHKFSELYPDKIYFLKSKDAIIQTEGEKSLGALLVQRKRWATKTTFYTDKKLLMLLTSVFIFCVSICLNLLLLPFFNIIVLAIGLIQLAIKMAADYFFLSKLADYFENRHLLKSFISSSFFHVSNIIYSGLAGLISKDYKWKGRRMK